MQMLAKIMNWVMRLIGYGLGATIILAVIALAIFGFTSFGARIITENVASALSNRDMTITVREPEGLLTGGLRAAEITLSDTRGTFAEIRGVAIDWNPLALLTGSFRAEQVSVASIDVRRRPVRTLPSRPATPEEESSGGFRLPLKIDVEHIALPDISLQAPLTGRAFSLAATGSLRADGDGGEALINVNRHQIPDAKLSADVAFTPANGHLRLNAQLAEPQGGLLAGFLGLPGSPAVNIALNGEGPISDWNGKLQAALDGQQRAALEGKHAITPDGLHHLDLKGGGDVSSLLPMAFRPLFAGQTNIDVSATFDNSGKIDIQTGNLATGSVVIAASGMFDPAGNNSLNANLLGTSGPVDFRWPLADGEARFMISGLNLAMTGQAQAVRINASGSLDSATMPQADIGNVKLTAKSDSFNLANGAGDIQLRLVAGDATFTEPNLNRAVRGPITLVAPLQISRNGIGFNGTTIESANIGADLNGSYGLADNTLTGNAKFTVQPAALPPAVAEKFDAPIDLETQVAGTIPSKVTLSNITLKSPTIEAAGNIALNDDVLTADLAGKLPDIDKLLAGTSGQADYSIKASGSLPALAITANVKAASLQMADRRLGDLNIDLTGTADPAAPQGRIAATGMIDRQPIGINGDVKSENGTISIPALTADVGSNRLAGNLTLSSGMTPAGALTFDFPDISLLAALGGQKAEGDLKGSIDITGNDGKIALKVAANGSGIRRDTLTIAKPTIDMTVSDIKAFAANGTIRADEFGVGTNKLTGIVLDFVQQQTRTDFNLDAGYDGNPLQAAGNVQSAGGMIDLSLDRFAAKPHNIPVELASPAQVNVTKGVVSLSGLTVKTGNGSVSVTGSAGETLKLDAVITDLPASLANSFVPNLAADGTISGTVNVTGTPAAPTVNFKLDWKDAATSHTKGAGIGPLGISTSGTFANNILNFDGGIGGADGLSLKAAGDIGLADPNGPTLNVDADIVNVPAKIANGFVPNLAAEGAVSGTIKATGTPAAPVADFKLIWKNAATSQTKSAKLTGLSLNASGRFADNKLDFDTALIGKGGLSLKALGNVAITGTTVGNINVDAELANVPANIANGFVQDFDAGGTISGTASATGTPAAPAGEFKFTWQDVTTRQVKTARLTGLNLAATGRLADQKLDFDASLTGPKGLSLKTAGNVELTGTTVRNLKVDADLANFPAGLANGFVPDLGAEGTISGKASASGSLPTPAVTFDLAWANAATRQTKSNGLTDLSARATGKYENNRVDFDANLGSGNGALLKATGGATIDGTDIRDLAVNADIAGLPANLANGFVPGLGAEGTISGNAVTSGTPTEPVVDFKLAWENAATLQTKTAGLSGLALAASGKYVSNRLDFDTNLNGNGGVSLKAVGNLALTGTTIQGIDAKADIANLPAAVANGFVPDIEAAGVITATATASGSLTAPSANFKIDWKNAETRQTRTAGLSGLALAASGKLDRDRLDFDANLSGNGGISLKAVGNLALAGTTIQGIDAKADITNLPAAIANGFVPDIGAGGVITATATASGSLTAPSADFKIDWKNAETRQTRTAGLSGLALSASGKLDRDRLDFDANLSGNGGVSLKASGNLAIAGTTITGVDVKADVANLPAAVANGFVPDLGAAGAISATGTASGALPLPSVDFKVDWKNAETSQTKSAGLAPLTIGANGRLAENRLTVDANLTGDGGLSLRGGGNLAMTGNRAMSMRFNGSLPFAVLGAQLAQQGLVAEGVANVNLEVSGTTAAPVINGTLATDGAKLIDVRRNLAIEGLGATITFNGQQAVISRLNGRLASGGSISASGSVGISGNFPADLSIRLDHAVYVDGTLVVATVDGTLGLRGPLLSNPTLNGRLHIDKASITVPERLPTSLSEIDIRHIHAPPAVLAQLKHKGNQQPPREKSSTIMLDIALDAPSQIFVRGRGIDAEVGGNITIRGSAAVPEVVGAFTMRRGRLTILNRRLDFSDRSRITFAGDLTPALDMEATSTSGSTTLTVNVAGLATDPAITFSSSPALPQDEVLAQLIFGQSMSRLSPVQIAQLADAVSQLAGNRSTSLFEGLRNQLGVDDLDISTNAKGQTSVSVGRYLNERTYFELQQSEGSGAKAIINLDVGRGVKLRAGAGGQGEGEAGVVYEHEY
ncbi:translocation/assembly module TamB domain-containing protein [Rhizobium sp. BK418]|uniref:translocation/assembly module TamB domain-containing protein n=1 Tax=Rhizobium sp. BK418 TaxID=2512120 RepID=UPI00104341CF|nr:translocation/assembly module TamB domain-containing protein [Rhizobium sp. BK418]TCS02149.1 autotransporter secretion inner membrane protein TamB [Rhizobium sp. BK418]